VKIVAELGASHGGDINRAVATIRQAAVCGADAIKLQTWTPGTMSAGGRVLDSGPWKGKYLSDLYEEAWTPWEWHPILAEEAMKAGMMWWSTPFDVGALEFLESLNCEVYKVASFEITDIPLIRAISATGKRIILSTGMATANEIEKALQAIHWSNHVTLLRCVSAYPASPEDFNLRTMVDMGTRWGRSYGLSDHTRSVALPVAAVAMGATMVERHLTLNPSDGLDDMFASTPQEFTAMVEAVRTTVDAMGGVRYGPAPSEQPSLELRRSLWIVKPMARGDVLTTDNLRTARPAAGLAPEFLPKLLKLKVNQDIKSGTPMSWDYVK